MSDYDDSQSFAPSQNAPSVGGAPSREVKPEKNINIKRINEEALIEMQNPKIMGKFPLGDKVKMKLNPFKSKLTGVE